jgi:hypothetical protein
MTYHGLKAGFWIKESGTVQYYAPGPWEYYETFFGGGEVFTAWAMLFPHSDLLAGTPDVVHWLSIGLVSMAISRSFGLASKPSLLVAISILCVQELSRYIGSGYVDTPATAFLLSGVYFLGYYSSNKKLSGFVLAALSFGLASSVKVNMLAISCIFILFALFLYIRFPNKNSRVLVYSGLLFVSSIMYWIIYNLGASGYMLGSAPISIGPIKFGMAPPNLQWLLFRPDIKPYEFKSEWESFSVVLSYFGPLISLAVIGLIYLPINMIKKRTMTLVMAFLTCGLVCAFYFSPSFSVIRIGGWSFVNGRFLTPAFVILCCAGGAFIYRLQNRGKWPELLLPSLTLVVTLYGFATYIKTFIWEVPNQSELIAIIAAAGSLIISYLILEKKKHVPIWLIATLAILTAPILTQYRRETRVESYAANIMIHQIPRYWVSALKAIDGQDRPLHIAVTHGWTESHTGVFAAFFGDRLQNDLVYITPSKDGTIIPHHPLLLKTAEFDFNAWLGRLLDARVTHVLCLSGANAVELGWMRSNPEWFKELTNMEQHGGIFQIITPLP